MRRNRYVVAAALLLVALAISANATAFVYRWLVGEVVIFQREPDNARGSLCTGFYSSADQPGIDLPEVGTNYNAGAGGHRVVSVEPGDIACRWYSHNEHYKLYESIRASFRLSVGGWHIRDFYGFGYYKRDDYDPRYVYVSLRVSNALNEPGIVDAKLFVYDAEYNSLVAILDLRRESGFEGPYVLPAYGAFRLSIYIESYEPVEYADFKVDFAVAEKPELPEP